jgi:hypothetical protein
MILKLSLSDEVAARLDSARGLHSRQEFVTNALIAALEGPCIERLIRAEIERMVESKPAHVPAQDYELKW